MWESSSTPPRTPKQMGKVVTTGRYHRHKRLEDDYSLTNEVLGEGISGQVMRATSHQSGEHVAVKGLNLKGVSTAKRELLETECEIYIAMDHPNVARLLDVYQTDDSLSLVMEYMSGGELFDRVREKGRFRETEGAYTVNQMLIAIRYIHKAHVVHRDIKLENFLYETATGNHLKLIDFGFAKVCSHDTNMDVSCGTLNYVAPEVLESRYTSKCDLWSLGVSTFVILFGYMPFRGTNEKMAQDIRTGKVSVRMQDWRSVSPDAQDFIQKLMVIDQTQRLSAKQALAHPWIANRMQRAATLDQKTISAIFDYGMAPPFLRAAMYLMAQHMKLEHEAKVRKTFLEMDEDRSGTISLQEFKHALMEHADGDTIEAMFRELDLTDKNAINYTEYLASMVVLFMDDNLMRKAFQHIDQDNSGYITSDKLKVVFGEHFDGEDVGQMMHDIHTSKLGELNFEEFKAYLRSNRDAPASEGGDRGQEPYLEGCATNRAEDLQQLPPIVEEEDQAPEVGPRSLVPVRLEIALESGNRASASLWLELELELMPGCGLDLEFDPTWTMPLLYR